MFFLFLWCNFNLWPCGGAVSHAAAARSVWLNHFIHRTQNAKWDTETSAAAASSSPGYHGDKRPVLSLSPPASRSLLPPLHERTRRVSCGAETCRSFSPDWRKDIASDRHGSLGAVHKGKTTAYLFIFQLACRLDVNVQLRAQSLQISSRSSQTASWQCLCRSGWKCVPQTASWAPRCF